MCTPAYLSAPDLPDDNSAGVAVYTVSDDLNVNEISLFSYDSSVDEVGSSVVSTPSSYIQISSLLI